MSNTKNWFIRRKGSPIKGPFPSGQIEQYLLLGRFVLSDEVSNDKIEWNKISTIPHLIPEILISAKYDELAQQKLASKKRWADERRGLITERPERERRNVEAKESNRHDSKLVNLKKQKLIIAYIQITLVILLVSVIAFLSFQYMPENIVSVANCSAKPAPNVNWTNCQKVGLRLSNIDMNNALVSSASLTGVKLTNVDFSDANFSYTELSISKISNVNFSNAKLVGAIIRNSVLINVNFHKSDLQYINLTGSTLRNANFSNANLSNAIWIDGRKCGLNSIGVCR